jgi:NSS family neurotransmitter:Na+ symporter
VALAHPLGMLSAFENRNIFETLDYTVSNFMMPLGGVLIALLAGWGLAKNATLQEMDIPESLLFRLWRLLVRYVVPLAIGLVFLVNI